MKGGALLDKKREEENYIFHRKLIELKEKKLISEEEFTHLLIMMNKANAIESKTSEVEDKVKNNANEKIINVEEKKEKQKEVAQTKERNTLLTLGIILICISAFIFATTTFIFAPAIIKFLLLVVISIGLIFISGKLYNKIITASVAAWVIGLILFPIDIVLLAYYKLLGNYLCFQGEGGLLLVSIIMFMIALIIHSTGKRYRSFISNIKYIDYAVSFFTYTGVLLIGIKCNEPIILLATILLVDIFDKEKTNIISDIFVAIVLIVTNGGILACILIGVYILRKRAVEIYDFTTTFIITSIAVVLNENPIIMLLIILFNIYSFRKSKKLSMLLNIQIAYVQIYLLFYNIGMAFGLEGIYSEIGIKIGFVLTILLLGIKYWVVKEKIDIYHGIITYLIFFIAMIDRIDKFYPMIILYMTMIIGFKFIYKGHKKFNDVLAFTAVITAMTSINLFENYQYINLAIATIILATIVIKETKKEYFIAIGVLMIYVISLTINRSYNEAYIAAMIILVLSYFNKRFLVVASTMFIPLIVDEGGTFILYEIIVLLLTMKFLENRIVYKIGFYITSFLAYLEFIEPSIKYEIITAILIMIIISRVVYMIFNEDKYYISTVLLFLINLIIIVNGTNLFNESIIVEFIYKLFAFGVFFIGIKLKRKDMVIPFFGFIVITFFIDTRDILNKIPWFIYLLSIGSFLVAYSINEEVNSKINKSKNKLREFIKLLK